MSLFMLSSNLKVPILSILDIGNLYDSWNGWVMNVLMQIENKVYLNLVALILITLKKLLFSTNPKGVSIFFIRDKVILVKQRTGLIMKNTILHKHIIDISHRISVNSSWGCILNSLANNCRSSFIFCIPNVCKAYRRE